MGDYTPTTEQVVSAYVWAVDMDDAEAREEEVRRWLTEHDQEVIENYLSSVPPDPFTIRVSQEQYNEILGHTVTDQHWSSSDDLQ